MLVLLQLWRPLGLGLLLAAAVAYRALLIHQRAAARAQAARLSAALSEAQAAGAAMRSAVEAYGRGLGMVPLAMAGALAIKAHTEPDPR
jgi:hypothetical protein